MKTPIWIAINYAKLYMGKLERFDIRNYSPFLAVARCPHCNDSQKNKTKTRFYCYEKDGTIGLFCHNCGHSSSLEKELREFDGYLYQQLLTDRFADSVETRRTEEPKRQQKRILNDSWKDCLVPVGFSPAANYLKARKVPQNQWKRLYYTPNLKHTYVNICDAMNIEVDTSKKIPEFECVFIPFLDEKGSLTFSTSRNMDSTSNLRYVTLEFQPSYKIFGIEQIDRNSTIYVTEGPLDSLFINNAVAVGDAALDRAGQVLPKDKLVLIPDNESRAPVQLKRISSFIDKGFSIVIWPKHILHKDINDMAKAGLNVKEIVELNTYQGLSAKLAFKNWAQI